MSEFSGSTIKNKVINKPLVGGVQFPPSAPINVRVVELVDTPVLETGAERHVGSSPALDTIKFIKKYVYQCEPKSLVHKNIWRVRLND